MFDKKHFENELLMWCFKHNFLLQHKIDDWDDALDEYIISDHNMEVFMQGNRQKLTDILKNGATDGKKKDH